jgi:hypothetical protein
MRFRNKHDAERHQNSLHPRRHSWSCAALAGHQEAAFHPSMTGDGGIDVCGYCGEEFANPPRWEMRAEHLHHVHKHGECNQAKKFFRADHFRQHLKHSHFGTSGKWTNMLENACMKDEPLPPLITTNDRRRVAESGTAQSLIPHTPSSASFWDLSPSDVANIKGNLDLNLRHSGDGESAQSQGNHTPRLRPYYLGRKLSKLFQGLAYWCRPTPRSDHSRLEWHCSCGQQFRGDFKSDEPEKLHRLAFELQRHGFVVDTTTKTTTASISSTTGIATSSQNRTTSAPTSSPNADPSMSTTLKAGISAKPSGTTPPAVQQTTISASTPLLSIGKPVYLELCINRSSRVTQLGEIIIVDGRGQQLINTDLELFCKCCSLPIATCTAV